MPRGIRDSKISNGAWLAVDAHYTPYDDPFWEFVWGPPDAGGFGPAPLENAFGRRWCSRRRRAGTGQSAAGRRLAALRSGRRRRRDRGHARCG